MDQKVNLYVLFYTNSIGYTVNFPFSCLKQAQNEAQHRTGRDGKEAGTVDGGEALLPDKENNIPAIIPLLQRPLFGFPGANRQLRMGNISQKFINNFPYLNLYFLKYYYNIKGKIISYDRTIFNSGSLSIFDHMHKDRFQTTISYCMQICG